MYCSSYCTAVVPKAIQGKRVLFWSFSPQNHCFVNKRVIVFAMVAPPKDVNGIAFDAVLMNPPSACDLGWIGHCVYNQDAI